MTREEWARAEHALSYEYNPVELLCDDYRLSLRLVRIGKMRLAITFFVNDEMRAKWGMEDCEERRRFFRPVARPIHTAEFRKSMERVSAKLLKEMHIDPQETYTAHSFYWTSFSALKRHLIKNNTLIRIAPVETRISERISELTI